MNIPQAGVIYASLILRLPEMFCSMSPTISSDPRILAMSAGVSLTARPLELS